MFPLIFTSLVGCETQAGGGGGGGSSGRSTRGSGLSVVLIDNPESEVSAVIGNAGGEALAVLSERGSSGEVSAVTGAVYKSPDGTELTVRLGPSGLPNTAEIDGWTIEFSNYRDTTADIVAYSPEGATHRESGVELDTAALEALRSYGSARTTGSSKHEPHAGKLVVTSEQIRVAGAAISAVACGIGIYTFWTGAGGVLALISCPSVLLSTAALVTDDPLLEMGATTLDAAGCVAADPGSCLVLAYDVVAEAAERQEAGATETTWERWQTVATPEFPSPDIFAFNYVGELHELRSGQSRAELTRWLETEFGEDINVTLSAFNDVLPASEETLFFRADVTDPASGESVSVAVFVQLNGTFTLGFIGQVTFDCEVNWRILVEGDALPEGTEEITGIESGRYEGTLGLGADRITWETAEGGGRAFFPDGTVEEWDIDVPSAWTRVPWS